MGCAWNRPLTLQNLPRPLILRVSQPTSEVAQMLLMESVQCDRRDMGSDIQESTEGHTVLQTCGRVYRILA